MSQRSYTDRNAAIAVSRDSAVPSNAYFGTYSLNEANGTLTLHIERASFPNWVGTDQQRQVASLTATDLKYTIPQPRPVEPPSSHGSAPSSD